MAAVNPDGTDTSVIADRTKSLGKKIAKTPSKTSPKRTETGEYICKICNKSILGENISVAYENNRTGINPLDPKTWATMHPGIFASCSSIYDIEYKQDVGFFNLSRKEYKDALEHGKIPERCQKYTNQFLPEKD